MNEVAKAYSATGAAWQAGPGRIYDRLAEVLVAASPSPLTGRRVLDVGAGTGAAGRAAAAAGARSVVAVDAALGMLLHADVPAAAGDALALPFRASAFDAAVAAFSLNHVDDPVSGLRELARVTTPGSPVLVATYAGDDTHPVKAAVEAALVDRGWGVEPWYRRLREQTVPQLATVERCSAAAADAGLDATVEARRVTFPELLPVDLVEWRLGMAQHAPFVAGLDDAARAEVVADVVARLGDEHPLERSVILTLAVTS